MSHLRQALALAPNFVARSLAQKTLGWLDAFHPVR
jgi:hypothetical protein